MKSSFFRISFLSLAVFTVASASVASARTAKFEDRGDDQKVREFVERDQIITNIKDAETMNLMEHKLPFQPWSDTFWPDLTGSIAMPYADKTYPRHPKSWPLNRKWLRDTRKRIYKDINSLSDDQINNLSPAEKYDLLVGDPDFTFTSQILNRVNELADRSLIDTFSGICHGWTPASLTLPRPKHSFVMKSFSGRPITFYPSDVKALESYLWASSMANENATKVVGWQCRAPERHLKLEFDHELTEYGRSKDKECFDVNPAFFHLLLLNQIGLNNRGFIMDREWEAKVQNQPVYGYKFAYYNPLLSWSEHGPLESARIPADLMIDDKLADPFKPYRSPRVKELVGVEVTVNFGYETEPNHDDTDSPEKDQVKDLTYHYTLELDEKGEIIGGEWQMYDKNKPNRKDRDSYSHPDVIWLVKKDQQAWTFGDADTIGTPWDGNSPMPQKWRDAAKKSATYTYGVWQIHEKNYRQTLRPQPLGMIVQVLLNKATN